MMEPHMLLIIIPLCLRFLKHVGFIRTKFFLKRRMVVVLLKHAWYIEKIVSGIIKNGTNHLYLHGTPSEQVGQYRVILYKNRIIQDTITPAKNAVVNTW
jgi:hypothetical protein